MDLGDQDLSGHPLYWIVFLPNIIPLFELSIIHYPSPLDVASTVDNTASLFLIAGLMDYICILMLEQLLGWILHEDKGSLRTLLLALGSSFRAWRFGFLAIRRACCVDWANWAEVKRLSYLLLLINPALLWHTGTLFLFGSGGTEYTDSQRWMKNVLWVLLVSGVDFGRKKADIADTDDGVNHSWMSSSLPVWIRLPLQSAVDTLIWMVLKLVPTIALAILAYLPTLLRALQKGFKWASSLQHRSRIISTLYNADVFAIRIRSAILCASVRWVRDVYNTIQARLLRHQ